MHSTSALTIAKARRSVRGDAAPPVNPVMKQGDRFAADAMDPVLGLRRLLHGT